MRPLAPWRGWTRHSAAVLRLSFQNPLALAYGYLVPVFFLLIYGSVFRSESPLLLHQMGALLTISILGGACFGLPMALVAERELGLWRRYRLLPVRLGGLVATTLVARLALIGLAAVIQLFLARGFYGTPLPLHPFQALVAFILVAGAFLGMGLLMAALPDNVPSAHALGLGLFVPLLALGGIGIPLSALPGWVQRIAGYLPGRYAVDVLQRVVSDPEGLHGAGFSLVALAVMGGAAGVIGLRRFRWNTRLEPGIFPRAWLTLTLLFWVAIGVTAQLTGH